MLNYAKTHRKSKREENAKISSNIATKYEINELILSQFSILEYHRQVN